MATIPTEDTQCLLTAEVAVPEPSKGYKKFHYSLSITIMDGVVSCSAVSRPFREMGDGGIRYAPEALNKGVSFTSSGDVTDAQAALVKAISNKLQAVINEA